MTDLRERARELAQDARRTVPMIFGQGDMDRLDAAITDAILRGMVECIDRAAIRGRLAQLEGKLVDVEIRAMAAELAKGMK